MHWTTTSSTDNQAPKWLFPPAPMGFREINNISGDIEQTYVVSAPVYDDRGPVLMLVELSERGSSEPPLRMLASADGTWVIVGHKWCEAGFFLRRGPIYEVALTAFDVAGNEWPAAATVEFGLPAEPTLTEKQWAALSHLRELAHLQSGVSGARDAKRRVSTWARAQQAARTTEAVVAAAMAAFVALALAARRFLRRRRARSRLGRYARS